MSSQAPEDTTFDMKELKKSLRGRRKLVIPWPKPVEGEYVEDESDDEFRHRLFLRQLAVMGWLRELDPSDEELFRVVADLA